MKIKIENINRKSNYKNKYYLNYTKITLPYYAL